VTKKQRQILSDSPYVRYLKQSNSQRQKLVWWLPGTGGTQDKVMNSTGIEIQLRKMKSVLEMGGVMAG
jgi:hypothetical protein